MHPAGSGCKSSLYVCMYERAAQLVSSAVVPGLLTSHKSFPHPYQAIVTFLYINLEYKVLDRIQTEYIVEEILDIVSLGVVL